VTRNFSKKIIAFFFSFFWALTATEQLVFSPVFQLTMENSLNPEIGSVPAVFDFSLKKVTPEFRMAYLGKGIVLLPKSLMEIPLEKPLVAGAVELIFLLNSKLPSDESISILLSYDNIILYYRRGLLYLTNGEKTIFLPVYHWNKKCVTHLVISWQVKDISMFVDGSEAIPCPRANLEKCSRKGEKGKLFIGNLEGRLDILLDNITIFNQPVPKTQIIERYQNILTRSVTFKRSSVTIPFFSTSPVIDGEVSDVAWEKATEISFFLHTGTYKVIERKSPRVFLGYNREGLYIAFVCFQPEGVMGEVVPRDDRRIVVEHDTFEFFLRPTMTWEHSYYQIIVNPAGSIYDGKILDSSWNGEIIYKTQLKNGTWSGELKIPFSTFESVQPKIGDKWTFNICRNFKTGGVELSQWMNTGGSYHSPERFAEVRFGEEDDWIKEKEISFQSEEIRIWLEVSEENECKGTMTVYPRGEITPFKTISVKGREITIRQGRDKVKNGVAEIFLQKQGSQNLVYLRMFEF